MGNVSSDCNYSDPAEETSHNGWEGTPNMNNIAAWNQWCPTSTSYDKVVVPSAGIEWQSLPEELVTLILDKLLESVDYVRFAAVCKEWYRLAKDMHTRDTNRWYRRRRPPMLLLPTTPTLDPPVLFNVSQMTTYKNPLDVPFPKVGRHRFCCGAGHGWLAKVVVYDFIRSSVPEICIQLFNPFRQAITTQTLPPYPTLDPGHDEASSPKAPRVVLSSDPALNRGDVWLLTFLIDGRQLFFHKRGQNGYGSLAAGRGSEFTDAIFYKGCFYAIDNRYGYLIIFDVEETNRRVVQIDGFERSSYRAYLVESTKGDLLCVYRFVKSSDGDQKKVTESFKVFKFELDNPIVTQVDVNQSVTTITQVEVTDIEDQSLFIGDTPSVSVVASDFGGCRPNSIYFTDDFMTCPVFDIEVLHRFEPQGVKYDVDIFSLADQSITSYNGRHFGPPLWITTPPPFDPLPVSNSTG